MSRTLALLSLALMFPSGSLAQVPPVAGGTSGAQVVWAPEVPVEGNLFRLEVTAPPGDTPMAGVRGRLGGEALHFREVEAGRFQALAPVPLDARGSVELRLTEILPGGRERTRAVFIPVEPGAYRFERLTVAPRYGSPPSPEDQARRAREAAKARAVSEAAHRTPRLWTDRAVLPRNDRVTSGFGNGREFNGQVTSRHTGLDLDGEVGDTVHAAARGVVELVDEFLLAGNIVYLNHGDGLVTGYFHLSDQLVAQGDTVEAGTPIGRVGATGRVTGPHLHWVLRYGYLSLDPRSLLEVLRPEGS